jgi:predicted PurR-regulated permease PerM
VAFSLDQFYRINQRVLLWVALFLLIWLLRDFFALIFMVFVLTFIATPLVDLGRRYLRLTERIAIVLVYLGFLAGLLIFLRFVAPRVVREANSLMGNLGTIETAVIQQKDAFVTRYPFLRPLINGYLRNSIPPEDLRQAGLSTLPSRTLARGEPLAGSALAEDQTLVHLYFDSLVQQVRDKAPRYVGFLLNTSATLLLALLFAFLIAFDIGRLKKELVSLKDSRLHDFYLQTAQPVVRFGYVVGRGLQAQAVIACLNTILTVAGLFILGIPDLALLSLIVFFCSFIPVLGVFLSTAPIVLVALNSGGLRQAFLAVVMVVVIHLVEAYLFNPIIYGRHLRLNPVLVLIILFLGHHTFGVWGMILGVPVAHYLIHDVLGVPLNRFRFLPEGGGPEEGVGTARGPGPPRDKGAPAEDAAAGT